MTDLLQLAREVAATTYEAMEAERRDTDTPEQWAAHVALFASFLRGGSYDANREVQTALAGIKAGMALETIKAFA